MIAIKSDTGQKNSKLQTPNSKLFPTFAAPNLFWQILPTGIPERDDHWEKPNLKPKNSGNEQLRIDGDFYSGTV